MTIIYELMERASTSERDKATARAMSARASMLSDPLLVPLRRIARAVAVESSVSDTAAEVREKLRAHAPYGLVASLRESEQWRPVTSNGNEKMLAGGRREPTPPSSAPPSTRNFALRPIKMAAPAASTPDYLEQAALPSNGATAPCRGGRGGQGGAARH